MVVLHESDKIKTIQDVDNIVSAQIPDINKYPKAYETVSKCLMHGPCGPAFPNAPCMKDGRCSKKFPKNLSENTIFIQDKSIRKIIFTILIR